MGWRSDVLRIMSALVTDALFRHAADRPGVLAAADASTRRTWSELAAEVSSTAAELSIQGLRPGDRVALCAPDGVPALVVALAVLHAGGVHAPVDHTLAEPEIARLIAVLRTPWAISLDSRKPKSTQPDLGVRLRATGESSGPDPLGPGASAFVRLSSGTTGSAKGVLLSHATILERVAAANQGLRLGPDDRVLWMLPMAYHFAVSILLYLQQGAAVVFGNSLRASTSAAIARAEEVTFAYVSPYHVRRFAELKPGDDLPPTLARVVSTTTALDAGAAEAFRVRHGLGVRQGLGIIEVGLPFLSDGSVGERPGELGCPLPAYRVAILSAAGGSSPVETPAGETGELAIAGPGLFDAYLEPWRPRAAVLDGGYFRTGDLAARDVDGRVRLLGRCKDVINVGGVKVFPLEVESVLDAHPRVVASRVRAAPDERLGELVHAEVQVCPGESGSRLISELEDWCAARLAPLKRPARITVVDSLPTTASGKVMRPG